MSKWGCLAIVFAVAGGCRSITVDEVDAAVNVAPDPIADLAEIVVSDDDGPAPGLESEVSDTLVDIPVLEDNRGLDVAVVDSVSDELTDDLPVVEVDPPKEIPVVDVGPPPPPGPCVGDPLIAGVPISSDMKLLRSRFDYNKDLLRVLFIGGPT